MKEEQQPNLEKNFLEEYFGEKVHLYLKNNFHYLCRVERIRNVNDCVFVEIWDFKSRSYLLVAIDQIRAIQEAQNENN